MHAIRVSLPGAYLKGVPTICGGFNNREGFMKGRPECYQLDLEDNMWRETENPMSYKRCWTAYAYDDNWGLVMAGGYEDTRVLMKSVEVTK